jgi:hypothetical protein
LTQAKRINREDREDAVMRLEAGRERHGGSFQKKYTQACTSTRMWPNFRTIVNIEIRQPSHNLTLTGKMRTNQPFRIQNLKTASHFRSSNYALHIPGFDQSW